MTFILAAQGIGSGHLEAAAVPSLVITTLVTIALTIAMLIYTIPAIFSAIVLSEIARSFLYATGNTFIELAYVFGDYY